MAPDAPIVDNLEKLYEVLSGRGMAAFEVEVLLVVNVDCMLTSRKITSFILVLVGICLCFRTYPLTPIKSLLLS